MKNMQKEPARKELDQNELGKVSGGIFVRPVNPDGIIVPVKPDEIVKPFNPNGQNGGNNGRGL